MSVTRAVFSGIQKGDIKAILKALNDEDDIGNYGGILVSSTLLDYELYNDFSKSKTDIAELLIMRGADVNERNMAKETPVHIAAYLGDTQKLKLLLQHRADPNVKNHSGHTPLFFAFSRNKAEVIKILLEHGADDFNVGDNCPTTLLEAAVRKSTGMPEFVEIVNLLKAAEAKNEASKMKNNPSFHGQGHPKL